MQSGVLTGDNKVSFKAALAIFISAFLTIILYVIPFLRPLAYPFLLISTLFHELAHGVVAVLLGGNFSSFKMYFDASGVASVSGDFNRISKALIAMAGLIGPSIIAFLAFINTVSKKRARIFLSLLGLSLSMVLFLLIKNVFGAIFLMLFISICFLFSLGSLKAYSQAFLSFLAMQLSLSVFSRSDYLFTKYAITSEGPMPSDVALIAQNLFLPYWFWGILCGLFSVFVLAMGIRSLIKNIF